VVLRLKKVEFFFDSLDRLNDAQLKATGLTRTLTLKNKTKKFQTFGDWHLVLQIKLMERNRTPF
jgi:hypothetical protein